MVNIDIYEKIKACPREKFLLFIKYIDKLLDKNEKILENFLHKFDFNLYREIMGYVPNEAQKLLEILNNMTRRLREIEMKYFNVFINELKKDEKKLKEFVDKYMIEKNKKAYQEIRMEEFLEFLYEKWCEKHQSEIYIEGLREYEEELWKNAKQYLTIKRIEEIILNTVEEINKEIIKEKVFNIKLKINKEYSKEEIDKCEEAYIFAFLYFPKEEFEYLIKFEDKIKNKDSKKLLIFYGICNRKFFNYLRRRISKEEIKEINDNIIEKAISIVNCKRKMEGRNPITKEKLIIIPSNLENTGYFGKYREFSKICDMIIGTCRICMESYSLDENMKPCPLNGNTMFLQEFFREAFKEIWNRIIKIASIKEINRMILNSVKIVNEKMVIKNEIQNKKE